MRFTRVRLADFKCYGEADVRLDPGVTVIHGLNGSGKSSLLEACFFALYGARALDRTLEAVVAIGAEDCEVELWFTHGGTDYHVERRVRRTDDRATTATCVLETPDGPVEGARAVRERVGELLRMDHEAFLNCAYVRQGEVNKLIEADPSARQDMIDELLQLGTLEAYRQRASDARVGVGRVRDDTRGALGQLDEQIAEKERRELHERLNELETDLSECVAEIDRIETQREAAVETRDEAREILDEHEERREELAELEDEIETIRETIAEAESERDDLRDERHELRDRLADAEDEREGALADTAVETADLDAIDERRESIETEREELRSEIEDERVAAQDHASEAESARERAEELEERAADEREAAADLDDECEALAERLEEREADRADLEDDIDAARETLADAPVDRDEVVEHRESVAEERADRREAIAETRNELSNQRERVDEAEALLEAGKCPACGQDVEGAPHVESIEDDRERVRELEADLADLEADLAACEERLERARELEATAQELADLEAERERLVEAIEADRDRLADLESEAESRREAAADLEAEAEALRETAAEHEAAAERCRERIGETNEALQDRRERIEALDALEAAVDRVAEIESEVERVGERREHLAELNDERRDRLAEKRERRDELREAVDEERIETAREDLQQAEDYVEEADAELDELRERRDELQGEVGQVENEIEELEFLRERHDALAARLDRLESLYEETEQLETLYGDLRAELRQRNVETLERMVNETFDLVYQNDAYARIELDGEYRLTVYQKDGEPLDPAQLSGGERALFNLSLRCAIYRLLAEGIEGAAPMPPLILDEPTVYLDSGHVTQLLDLVAYMRDEVGVEQILVVSHDEELVGAADALVRVEKDATSNRSTARRVEAASLPA